LHEYLALIVGGLADGSIVAIAAMGLVMSYKASGIFNFAQGAIGAVAAGLFYQLHVLDHVPVWLAMLITLAVAGVGLGLVMERVAFLVAPTSTTMKVVAMVGIMISLTALFTLRFGGVTKTYPAYLPQSGFQVAGVNVSWDKLVFVILGVACAIAMTVFFRRTILGRSMRAIVDDPVLVSHLGISPNRVRRWAWIIGTVFAALAGVLIAPSLGLDGTSLTLLVVASFGACAIGGFSSLILTYVGALGIQVLVSVSTKWASTYPAVRALPTAIPFIVLFAVLLLTPRRRLVEIGSSLQVRATMLPPPKLWIGALRLLPAAILLLLLPQLVGAHLLVWTQGLVFVILMMSLSLLVRTSNQISLCQMSFAAVGAVAYYRVTQAGGPWVLAVIAAGLTAIPVGALIAFTAIRLSGVYLALATLAFGVVMETAVFNTWLMFGGSVVPLDAPRPSFAESDQRYYYLVLAVVAVCYAIVRILERSRLGQLLRSLADAPLALEALGVRNSSLQTVAFCAAAFLAGIAGSLLGPIFSVVGSTNFQTIPTSLLLVALLVLGSRNPRIGTFGAALGGAIGMVVIPQYINSNTVLQCLNLFFGLAAVEAAVASTRPFHPMRAPWNRWLDRRRGPTPTAAGAPAAAFAPAAHEAARSDEPDRARP
jgi:branched-subunit amino acid ABC-type transport system permease component